MPEELLNEIDQESNIPSSGKKDSSTASEQEVPLKGTASLNVNQGPQMPPVAPPIKRPFTGQVNRDYMNGSVNRNQTNLRPQTPLMAPKSDRKVGSILKKMFDLNARQEKIKRPAWIPGNAYSNSRMVAPYHNNDLAFWDKKPMPNRPQWVILSTSVTRYWRGYAPNPCWILVAPNPLAPGHFTFRSKVPNGPRGWLEALDETSKFGFPLYRYWLDQPM